MYSRFTIWNAVAFFVITCPTPACAPSQPQAGPAKATTTPSSSSSAPNAAPKIPPPTVWFEPMDGTTSVGDMTPRIAIDNFELPVGSALLDQVVAAVSLQTWPEQTSIAASMSVKDASSSGDPRAKILLKPNSPLGDRWYAVRLSKLPVGLAWPTYPTHHALQDGSVVARFRVGSEPSVWGVRVCDKGEIIADLSEKVVASKAPSELFSIAHAGASGPSCQSPGSAGAQGTGEFIFNCSGIQEKVPLDLSVAPGLAGLSGQALSPVNYEFTLAQLPPWGDGCRIFRP